MKAVCGRYAPSPTGAQHVGNLRSAVLAWVDAHIHGGGCALRIDDLDLPRVVTGSEAAIREELAWIGLRFDPLPKTGRLALEGNAESHAACRQSDRSARYAEVLEALRLAGAIYPCPLSGKEFAGALAAPHAETESRLRLDLGERERLWERYRAEPSGALSWRFAASELPVGFCDETFGEQRSGAAGLDDFIVWRRDGLPSYQLACVVDDFDLGVERVVRGADLIESTFRQLALLRALKWSEPAYKHLSLVESSDGKRLAKRHGAKSIEALRRDGMSPAQMLSWIAASVCPASKEPLQNVEELADRLAGQPWGQQSVCFEA
jgi:glutamyl-tRNA synthetase